MNTKSKWFLIMSFCFSFSIFITSLVFAFDNFNPLDRDKKKNGFKKYPFEKFQIFEKIFSNIANHLIGKYSNYELLFQPKIKEIQKLNSQINQKIK